MPFSSRGWTPYNGMKVTGWSVSTVVRGHVVMQDGELLGKMIGMPANFQETIPIANRGPTSSQANIKQESAMIDGLTVSGTFSGGQPNGRR